MKKYWSLILSCVFIIAGLIKFDIFIYPTLDYFGKYVFVLALNIVPFWFVWDFHKKNQFLSLGFGVLAGALFYWMG